jgi:hypothetical protein
MYDNMIILLGIKLWTKYAKEQAREAAAHAHDNDTPTHHNYFGATKAYTEELRYWDEYIIDELYDKLVDIEMMESEV